MSTMKQLVERIVREESGQDMVEYALVLGVIAVAGLTALIALGPKVADLWNDANSGVPAAD